MHESKANDLVWIPTKEQIESANITNFMKAHGLATYEQLVEKAVQNPDWFYPEILQELEIHWMKKYDKVVDLSNGKERPIWFLGGETNVYLYGLFKHIKAGRGNELALIWEGEDGRVVKRTYQQLKEETDQLASGLHSLGVRKGDRIGVFLPQIPEIQPILFAAAKLGAVVIPCFSGFGAEAVALRLNDGEAKWLITADGFQRKGKSVNLRTVTREVLKKVPTIDRCIIVPHQSRQRKASSDFIEKEISYGDLLKKVNIKLPVVPMKSDEPFLIIYTSGTTGKPKGTLHTHYSFPLKNAIDMFFSFDVKKGDRIFWLTDIGWMMGPWHMFGSAVLGATAVMYEGSPDYPTKNRLWELLERHQVTIMGIAPTVIRSLMNSTINPSREFNLTSLRILGSTGEAWNPKPWLWYFENVGGKNCPIINYSGGTEISGGILTCVPIKPLKPCSFHGPAPGMAAEVYDSAGNIAETNQIGDLVITEPFLGMTCSFWKDTERYLRTYWDTWPGVWHHGDFAQVDENGFWYILGRSDDTMNIAGKRIGPVDLESTICNHPAVKEAAAIGIPDEIKGEVPIVFVVTVEEESNQAQLQIELNETIGKSLGKAFLPKNIYFVDSLPRTQSGKVARRVIRSAFLGMELGDISTLQNKESINYFRPKG